MTSGVDYMARAVRLARQGLWTTQPNPRVGCVLVKQGKIVGEGWHQYAGGPHAEINALRHAGEAAKGADCYVTLEPCCHHGRTPPCTDALIKAGVQRVVVAMADPNPLVAGEGLQALSDAGIETQSGLLLKEAEDLNPGFIMRMRKQRPFFRIKLASSLDGRTAMKNGESQWITGAAARCDVQGWRARSSAIMSGAATILADDPALTVRPDELPPYLPVPAKLHHPLRIVIDRDLSTPPQAKLFSLPGDVLIVSGCDNSLRKQALHNAGAEILVLPDEKGGVDFVALCRELARREINEVQVEAGSSLTGSLLKAGLMDEFILYMAPVLMGDNARGLFHLPGLNSMQQRIHLAIRDIRAVGQDWRITAQLDGNSD